MVAPAVDRERTSSTRSAQVCIGRNARNEDSQTTCCKMLKGLMPGSASAEWKEAEYSEYSLYLGYRWLKHLHSICHDRLDGLAIYHDAPSEKNEAQ